MRRRLPTILCILSTAFAVLVLIIWILSNYWTGNLSFTRVRPAGPDHVVQYRNFEWFANKFSLYVGRYTLLNPDAYKNEIAQSGNGWTVHLYHTAGLEDNVDWTKYGPSILGGQFQQEDLNHPDAVGSRIVVNIPFWWLVALGSIYPAIWWWRRLRTRHREKTGRCLNCGYDLRASADRCPECGAPRPATTTPVSSG
jgi:ABC-type sugar transport system permease subunit